jgi:hypothetical protein
MRTCQRFLPVLVLVLFPVSLLASDQPAAPTGPPAELSQLAFLTGTWHCSGKGFATPFGPERATEATVTSAPAVGGWWQELKYDEKKSSANPMPVHAAMIMGFDSEKKQFVGVCFDSFGQHCAQTSSGWSGDTMIFDGHSSMGDGTMGVRDTFTKTAANKLTHLGEMQGPDGTWMKLDEEHCTKSSAK